MEIGGKSVYSKGREVEGYRSGQNALRGRYFQCCCARRTPTSEWLEQTGVVAQLIMES